MVVEADSKDTNATLGFLDTLAQALGGTHSKQGAVEWWTYWLMDEILSVRYHYAAHSKGAYTVYAREGGAFGATLEQTRQHFGEATLTELCRTEMALEEAVTRLGLAALRKRRPELLGRVQRIADFSERDAYVFVRMSDLEPLVQFGSVESLEGCLYLFSVQARPEAQPTAQPHAA